MKRGSIRYSLVWTSLLLLCGPVSPSSGVRTPAVPPLPPPSLSPARPPLGLATACLAEIESGQTFSTPLRDIARLAKPGKPPKPTP